MKKARKDKTIAEKLDLLDRYKTFSLVSQREAAERLGVSRRLLQGLIKNEATICTAAAASSVSGVKWKRSGKDGSVVEWLKHRTDDQHGGGSKPTCAILLCPWERHFTALSPAWWS